MSVKLYAAASQTLFARDLRDANDALVSGAVVTATLANRYTHDTIADQFLAAASMTEVEGTPGTYTCEIPNTFVPPLGRAYVIIFTISKGGNTVQIEKAAEVLHLVTQ